MTAQSFAGEILRLGSRDPLGAGNAGPVLELQSQLSDVGVLQANEAVTHGTFDTCTDTAVRRLQWFASNVPGCLSSAGQYVPRSLLHLSVDGVVGPHVRAFLKLMRDRRWTVTGLLVAVDMDFLSHVNPNANFHALCGQDQTIGICEREFVEVLLGMNRSAKANGIFVFVNQLFRVEGATVSGAVVPPASHSAHKIGRAVDLQLGTSEKIVTGVNPQLAQKIKVAEVGTPFAKFREHAKSSLHCRYGGEFSISDAPHFDRQVSPSGHPRWKYHYFFDQLQYQQYLHHPAAIPAAHL
jgi:hypothetical protein